MRPTRRAHLLAGFLLGLGAAHTAGALTVQDPYYRAALALLVSAVVLTVWGVSVCLREHRAEQGR